jgi:hypothetical protein
MLDFHNCKKKEAPAATTPRRPGREEAACLTAYTVGFSTICDFSRKIRIVIEFIPLRIGTVFAETVSCVSASFSSNCFRFQLEVRSNLSITDLSMPLEARNLRLNFGTSFFFVRYFMR